jgi:hypothetical protein
MRLCNGDVLYAVSSALAVTSTSTETTSSSARSRIVEQVARPRRKFRERHLRLAVVLDLLSHLVAQHGPPGDPFCHRRRVGLANAGHPRETMSGGPASTRGSQQAATRRAIQAATMTSREDPGQGTASPVLLLTGR